MANVFVDSNAVGLNDGSDWANAFTTMVAGVAALSTGDSLIWADVSAETVGAVTLSFPTGCFLITSTVTGTAVITTTTAASSQYSNTANNSSGDLRFNGTDLYVYGSHIRAGRNLYFTRAIIEDGKIFCGNGNGSASSVNASGNNSTLTMINTESGTLSTIANGTIYVMGSRSAMKLLGGSGTSASSNTGQQGFLMGNEGSQLICDGVDFSGIPCGTLVNLTGKTSPFVRITRMTISASTTSLANGLPDGVGSDVTIDCTDSSNTVNRQYSANDLGELFSDSGIVLDSTNPDSDTISNKIVTSADATEFIMPFRVSIVNGWADFSTAKTIDIEIAQDGTTTALTDTEAWIEVQYPDDSTAAFHLETDRAADNQSGVNQASSTASWTGLSGTNVKQKLSVTTTQTGKQGIYQVFLCLSKPSTTLYVNPKADIS